MNAQASALEAAYQRNTMAKMHAAFSCGLFAAALVTSGITALSRSLAAHFGVAAVILGVFLALAWSGALTEDAPATESAPSSESSPDSPGRRRWRKPVLVAVWLSLALVFGEVTEGAMNDWSALYLKDVVHAGPSVTPLGIAVVSAMMLLARLFADGWRSRWGDQRVVVVGATVAAVGLAAALLAGGVVPTLIGFACVGLGMAAVTPCIYVGAARLGPEVLALVATMGTIGLLAGPPVIGFIAEQTSLVGGMSAVAVLALLAAACASRINWPAEVPAPAAADSDVDDRNRVTQL
jgi:Na+/melibiose symporter-like transporter